MGNKEEERNGIPRTYLLGLILVLLTSSGLKKVQITTKGTFLTLKECNKRSISCEILSYLPITNQTEVLEWHIHHMSKENEF